MNMTQLKKMYLQLLQLVATVTLVSGADVPPDTFSCNGLAAGFYADIASGCQLYHMCDGAGRQYTHACPNQTLFQQRTMICDHWYMVKCNPLELNGDKVLKSENIPETQFQGQGKSQKPHRHSQRVLEPFPYTQRNVTSRGNFTERGRTESTHIGITSKFRDDISPIKSQQSNSRQNLYSLSSSQISTNNGSSSSLSSQVRTQTERTINKVNNHNLGQVRTTDITSPSVSGIPPFSYQVHVPSTSFPPEVTSFPTLKPTINAQNLQRSEKNENTHHSSNIQYKLPESANYRKTVNNEEIEDLVVKYSHNPYLQSYFRTITKTKDDSQKLLVSVPNSHLEDERETFENKLEIILPDPRKMFYIPDSNYGQSENSDEQKSSVLVIDLPDYHQSSSLTTMKFLSSSNGKQGYNPECPRCHPSFLLPGQCQPCVLIR